MVDAVAGELLRRCSAQDEVTLQTCIYDLHDNLLVCEAHYKAVLGCIVFILRLCNETLAGIVCVTDNRVSTEKEFSLSREKSDVQSVLPSRRRRYLTWKREK